MAIYTPLGKGSNQPKKCLRQYYHVHQPLMKAVSPPLNVLNNEYGAECMMFVAEHTLTRLARYQ
jgi:hypothetical protein